MDNKTMQKVINGISEKLEKFIDSIDKKFDLAGDLFKKSQNQIKGQEDKIEELDDKISSLKMINIQELDDKIEELDKRIIKVNDRTSKLIEQSGDYIIDLKVKIAKLEKNEDYKKLWQENTDDYNELARKRLGDYEKIEELESKYYKLRSELDSVYKVLEMDALDLQALQDKTFNGATRDNNKFGACAEYEAEQMLIDENNRLNDEHLSNKGGE